MQKLFVLLLFIPVVTFAALSKTFPTSNVTKVRLSGYYDGIRTTALSTDTIKVGQWDSIASSYTWIHNDQHVDVSYYVYEGTNTVVIPHSMTLQEYTDLIIEETRLRVINEIVNQDLEIYFVWPGTSPPRGWVGWCQGEINGRNIPVLCP